MIKPTSGGAVAAHPPSIPKAVARRIDRLAWRAHWFHRYAHHPLCDAYAAEVIHLPRRVRLCRGCALAGLGILLGVGAGLAFAPSVPAAAVVGLAGAALAGVGFWRRLGKAWTRLAPATALSCAAAAGARQGTLAGLVLAGVVLAGIAALVVLYRRRTPDRSPCASCPERTREDPCSGLIPIVRRERAFQRLARRWMDRPSP